MKRLLGDDLDRLEKGGVASVDVAGPFPPRQQRINVPPAEPGGFSPEQIAWNYTPFNLSWAPGPKDFDVYVTQVSYKPARAEAVDFSDSYYDVNQAVITLADNAFAGATTITELKDAQLGAQVGTTSYDVIIDVIGPNKEPLVFDDNDKALNALKVGTIDGLGMLNGSNTKARIRITARMGSPHTRTNSASGWPERGGSG